MLVAYEAQIAAIIDEPTACVVKIRITFPRDSTSERYRHEPRQPTCRGRVSRRQVTYSRDDVMPLNHTSMIVSAEEEQCYEVHIL